jgi:hypothetical protein
MALGAPFLTRSLRETRGFLLPLHHNLLTPTPIPHPRTLTPRRTHSGIALLQRDLRSTAHRNHQTRQPRARTPAHTPREHDRRQENKNESLHASASNKNGHHEIGGQIAISQLRAERRLYPVSPVSSVVDQIFLSVLDVLRGSVPFSIHHPCRNQRRHLHRIRRTRHTARQSPATCHRNISHTRCSSTSRKRHPSAISIDHCGARCR